jgi:uncharacterized protein (DUF1697 family)
VIVSSISKSTAASATTSRYRFVSWCARRRTAIANDRGGRVYARLVPVYIALLRGINLGATDRVSMPKLRELLAEAGFEDVRTYLQSGNVVLSSRAKPAEVSTKCERAIEKELGLEIKIVVRTRAQLAAVVKRDPLGKVAKNPKRYQVSFLAAKPKAEALRKLEAAVVPPERLVVSGREIYAWHPEGVARSKLWSMLAGPGLGVTATARNWTTVTSLLALAGEG